ncbi:uncharacterized protein TNCV_831921 [Trichonephila clavipes]|nr:uncharacterized protein TNCV_831921 [Trichonephila clavipes]
MQTHPTYPTEDEFSFIAGTGFLKRKFPSTLDSSEFGQYSLGEDSSRRSYQPSNLGDPYGQRDSYRLRPELDEFRPNPEPPTQSAFLDVFRNTSDRRPSTTGFLRRPSAVNLRRPSTVIELNIRPSQFDQRQEPFPIRPPGDPYNPYFPQQQADRYRPPQLSIHEVVVDHLSQYYEAKPDPKEGDRNFVKKPAIDLTELSKLYGIPLTTPSMEDEEGLPFVPQRRLTLPTVMDQVDSGDGGMVRTGSLYSATRKTESASKTGSLVGARKKSLPDISNAAAMEGRVLSRETIAILSSQRREAIRRQEEEAERLRANPFLYLVSPEVWDWISSQQLTILVIVVNVALGFLFFKVIL